MDRGFSSMDTFTWHGLEFWCVDTRGNSPGGMSYLIKKDKGWVAFSGEVMLAGARMHNYFDTEWDYGFAAGIYALHNSAALLERFEPILLLLSHGQVVPDPKAPLQESQRKLRRLADDVLWGCDEGRFAGADQDRVSKPTAVPYVWQVTPHRQKTKNSQNSLEESLPHPGPLPNSQTVGPPVTTLPRKSAKLAKQPGGVPSAPHSQTPHSQTRKLSAAR